MRENSFVKFGYGTASACNGGFEFDLLQHYVFILAF